jgi:hypothetical protein
MLAELRTMHREIGDVLRRLEELAPVVASWLAAQRPQEPESEVARGGGCAGWQTTRSRLSTGP